jgi:NAD-dependent deacetylase
MLFMPYCVRQMSMGDDTNSLTRSEVMLAAARRITVLTGAGISTASGIPDFRGPNGLWTRDPMAQRASTLRYYLNDEDLRKRAWQNRLKWIDNDPRPNDGHLALCHLQQRGQLCGVVTQNVDGLHQRAGIDPQFVHEVHGNINRSRCWECGDKRPMRDTLQRVVDGDPDPRCLLCGGVLKSDTILFEEPLVPEVIEAAYRASEQCDVLLAVGSTLAVYPAAYCVPRAKAAGARVVIVNGEPTEMDGLADEVVQGDINEVLPRLCGVRPTP